MQISNEDIIQSARRQRQAINSRMDVDSWSPRPRKTRSLAAVMAIAASLVSFIAGYGLHAAHAPQPHDAQPLAQAIEVQHDTVVQTNTVHDTIYQTRTVTKYMKPMEPLVAQSPTQPTESSTAEMMACSMLCDDIPYDLLARP